MNETTSDVLSRADYITIRSLIGKAMTDVEERTKHLTKQQLNILRMYQLQVLCKIEQDLQSYYQIDL